MASGIQASVGAGGANQYNDVKVIQALLNDARHAEPTFRATTGELSVDGKVGPMTVSAIVNYQDKIVRLARPDGRIDPGGKTWTKLNGSKQCVDEIEVMQADQSSTDWWRDFFYSPEETWMGRQVSSAYNYFSDLFTWDSDEEDNSGTPTSTNVIRTYNQAQNPKEYESFKQGNYKDVKLGHSTSTTISRTGCLLTSLTMAATVFGKRNQNWPAGLKPADLTPPKANDIATKAGAFAKGTGIMFVERGATALGMTCKQYGWDRVNGGHIPLKGSDYEDLCKHIDAGKPALGHVDYFKKSKDKKKGETYSYHPAGDHWILITHRKNTIFTAIDPAYGKKISLNRDSAASTREKELGKQIGQTKAILWSQSIGSSGNKYYRLVRFGLLDRIGGSDGVQVATSTATSGDTKPKKNTGGNIGGMEGQLTYDCEGNDTPSSIYYSRVPHWPGSWSGVTIGRGYDMKHRSADEVKGDLTKAGVSQDVATKLAGGAKLTGDAAKKFCKDNKDIEITNPQQKALFKTVYGEKARYAARLAKKWSEVKWEDVSKVMKDILVDLFYRGDVTKSKWDANDMGTVVKENDLAGMKKLLQNKGLWGNVDNNRYNQRIKYISKAVPG